MDRVTVYRFTLKGDETCANMLAPRAATAARIRQITNAEIVVESALVVDGHCIDGRGFLIDGHCCSDS